MATGVAPRHDDDRAKGAEQVAVDVVKYLEDAHAIEAQSMRLLERAPAISCGHEDPGHR
jgi:hypothetical protein